MSMNLTVVPAGSPAVTRGRSNGGLPTEIANAIREVMVAFPSPNLSSEERSMQLGIYRDAVLPFEPELVLVVLKHLRLHNPRNRPTYTQPPTPQDVYEALGARRKQWASQCSEYFFGEMEYDLSERRQKWKRSCEELPCSRSLAEKLTVESFKRDKVEQFILRMSDDAFDGLPAAILADGWRDIYLDLRQHLAYLRSLDDVTYHIRRAALLADRERRFLGDDERPELTEVALMELTRELAAEFRSANPSLAEADAKPHLVDFIKAKGLRLSVEGLFDTEDLRCKRPVRRTVTANAAVSGLIASATKHMAVGAA